LVIDLFTPGLLWRQEVPLGRSACPRDRDALRDGRRWRRRAGEGALCGCRAGVAQSPRTDVIAVTHMALFLVDGRAGSAVVAGNGLARDLDLSPRRV